MGTVSGFWTSRTGQRETPGQATIGIKAPFTLFMAKWFGPNRIDELLQAKTGQVLTTCVDVPHAGWP